MAIIKAINSKNSIGGIINYVADREKTTEELIYGQNCSSNPEQAIEDMKMTKELYNKENGRQYKHFVQSFDPKDKITPQKSNEIGREWSKDVFKGYEVFIVTHTNKEHIHNHFIVNTVNFETGEKYRQSKADLKKYKELSDKICEREGLMKTPNKSKNISSFDMKKYKVIEEDIKGSKKSYLVQTGRDVEESINISTSKNDFIKNMELRGYKVKWSDTAKSVTYINQDEKKVRNTNLEKTFKQEIFDKENMLQKFEQNKELVKEKIKKINADKVDTGEKIFRDSKRNELEKNINILQIKVENLINQKNELEKQYKEFFNRERGYKEQLDTNEKRIEKIRNLKSAINNELEKKENLKGFRGLFKGSEKKQCDDKIKRYKENIEELKSKLLDKNELNNLKDKYKEFKQKADQEDAELSKCKIQLDIDKYDLEYKQDKLDKLGSEITENIDSVEYAYRKDPEILKQIKEEKERGQEFISYDKSRDKRLNQNKDYGLEL